MPFRHSHSRSYQDCKQFCRSSSICGSFFAMIWCINMLVSAVTSLTYVSDYFDAWIETEAMIIGRNMTVHYRRTNATSNDERRFLLGSKIPNFSADDLASLLENNNNFGNETEDVFGSNNDGNLTNSTNNDTTNEWPDDGNGGILGDLDSWNDLLGNNATDTPDNNNNNNTAANNTDMDNLSDDATTAPTLPPVVVDVDVDDDGGRLVYCAEVRFQVNSNLTITAVSDTYCSYDPDDIVVGLVFIILYNPNMPTEIIEESLYVHAQNTLRLTVGVTIFFTIGYLLCSIYLWRSQPDMTRGMMMFPQSNTHDSELQVNGVHEITQTPQEREALMQSKFHFQTVLEDLSNTNAKSIRRLCLKMDGDKNLEEAVIECSNGDCACDNMANKLDAEKNGRLEVVDIEAQEDPLEEMEEGGNDVELDLSDKKEPSIDGEISMSSTETETDTDAGSNNQESSTESETNDNVHQSQKPQQQQQESSSSSPEEPTWSLAGASNLISSWTNAALAPSAPECCICLETYQPGDKICTSKSAEGCDHVFHQQCIEAWLHRHDACPLCRVDLMNTTSAANNETEE